MPSAPHPSPDREHMAVSSKPVRVAVVSPQPVVGKGLVALLGEHPDRVATTDVPEADVVLYDVLGIDRTDGADLARVLQDTESVVVAVSRDLRPDLRTRALAAGAHYWISMSADSTTLVEAVESAVTGRRAPGTTDRLGETAGLTPREVEVLALITQGLSNQEIAEHLYLSINSVKTYIRSAYAKIGATSRSRAVAWCLQHGFAPPADRRSAAPRP